MAISTLIVGLGGTGVLTLRALKKLYDELPKSERVPTDFLAFDFDRAALMAEDAKSRFAKLDDADFYYLNPKGIQDLLRNLDRADNGGLAWNKILQWFPERSHVQIPISEVESNGASQLRVLGRLGFFLNDETIEGALRRKLNQLGSEVDPSSLAEDKRVILVSSIAGGTGAGMMIDMAYIARRHAVRPRVWAYLLLPEVFEDVDSGGRIFQNAYACLKELAYLKEQLIPFEAPYYRIPPVDVPVSGEEPFARIFLARGDGFSGADAIKAATHQMAETILAQLQRTIQEKTLSVVSNTLSASAQDEQRKKRTHCFSAATSVFLKLKPVAPTAEVLFKILSQRLKDPAFLAAILSKDVQAIFGQLRERIEGADTPAAGPAPGEGGDAVLKDEQVRDLLREWRKRIERHAKTAQEELVKDLEQKLDHACLLARSGRKEKASEGIREIGELEKLILFDRQREKYDGNLENLKNLPAFVNFDKSLKDEARTHLRAAEGMLGTEENLKRKAFYSKIDQFDPMLWVTFPSGEVREEQDYAKQLAAVRARLGAAKRPGWWQRLLRPYLPSVHDTVSVLAAADVLRKALHEPDERTYFEKVFTVRALNTLKDEVRRNLDAVEKNLQPVEQVWANLSPGQSIQGVEVTERQEREVMKVLGPRLPDILEEAQATIKPGETAETRGKKLLALLRRRVEKDPALHQQQYEIEIDGDTDAGDLRQQVEERLRENLVRSRQKVFERRTPNLQRKGFTFIMIPQGMLWPAGDRQELRDFLEASASQILNSRTQVEDYDGSRIWIYSEDLFNPPEHIKNLDEYFRTYDHQKYKELFHIDRRMLDNPVFRDINSSTSTIVVHCGNPGCVENIGAVSRAQTICPHCDRPIRTRCGNPSCTSNELDREEWRQVKTCPACGGYNHAAWWRCCQHGKIEVDVPIDKDRCPRCIEEHQKDPVGWPAQKISVRPDLLDREVCHHCTDLNEKEPTHEVFRIPKDLLPFYRNGVNGHDKKPFFALAQRYRLPGSIRCPECRTILIPVHHERGTDECKRRVRS